MKNLFLLAVVWSMAQFAAWSVDCIGTDYIKQYGRLKLVGTQLSAEDGRPVQLKGWTSDNWEAGWGACHDSLQLKRMNSLGTSLYRGAMSVEGGYAQDKEAYLRLTKDFIDRTAEQGMYYVCDWNVSLVSNPAAPAYAEAPAYFDEISSYVAAKGYKHVLYEICGEPSTYSWDSIKSYADEVLPIIERNDSGACVIVGTPSWCQGIEKPEADPITNYSGLNILYAFHYYACNHAQFLGRLERAAQSIPVFISEWGDWVDKEAEGTLESHCIPDAKKLQEVVTNADRQLISMCARASAAVDKKSVVLQDCNDLRFSQFGLELLPVRGFYDCDLTPESGNTDFRSDNLLLTPNPSCGAFMVVSPGGLQITNLVGEVVFSASVEANVEVSTGLPAGNYIATLKTADAVKVTKLVVK